MNFMLNLDIAEHLLDNVSNGIFITDSSTNILYVNAAFSRITGYTSEEAVGKNPRILNSGLMSKDFYTDMWKKLEKYGEFESVFNNRKKCGSLYLQAACVKKFVGSEIYYVCIFLDTTDDMDKYVHVDQLTGLPNRIGMHVALQKYTDVCSITKNNIGIMYIDLDRFKVINDALGHVTGDKFLVEISKRLSSVIRDSDYLCRVGGDEFVCICYGNRKNLEIIAKKIISSLEKEIDVDSYLLHTSCSIGIAVYPEDSLSIPDLLRNSDSALYHSKNIGKNCFSFYNEELTVKNNRELVIENSLRKSVVDFDFTFVYQPQYCLTTGDIIAVEALCRWTDAQLGEVSPAEFIPIAESTHLIVYLGNKIIDHCVSLLSRCVECDCNIAINVSTIQLKYSNVIEYIESVRVKYGVERSRIELEFTETYALDNSDYIVEQIEKLAEYGYKVSLDDFGVGYANIKNIKRMGLSKLKIDKFFADNIVSDPRDLKLIKSIMQFGKSLDLKVVAEGIENMEQLSLLKRCGCDIVQGYVLSKPIPQDALEKLLTANVNGTDPVKIMLLDLNGEY